MPKTWWWFGASLSLPPNALPNLALTLRKSGGSIYNQTDSELPSYGLSTDKISEQMDLCSESYVLKPTGSKTLGWCYSAESTGVHQLERNPATPEATNQHQQELETYWNRS